MPYFPANWATDIYSIIHAISLYRQDFIRYSGANILFFADNGKFLAKNTLIILDSLHSLPLLLGRHLATEDAEEVMARGLRH